MIDIIFKSKELQEGKTFCGSETHTHLLHKTLRLSLLLNERKQIFHDAVKHQWSHPWIYGELADCIWQIIVPTLFQIFQPQKENKLKKRTKEMK